MIHDSSKKVRVALIGATGLVGRTVLKLIMDDKNTDCWSISLFASKSHELSIEGISLNVSSIEQANFSDFDLCLFATGEEVSKIWIEKALHAGARVVDSSSWRRLDPLVPLIVPGVNHKILKKEDRLCSHSNCIVSPLACVLAPIHHLYGLKCVYISTYQSVSGAGKQGVEACFMETKNKLSGQCVNTHYFPRSIGFNVIPQIGDFDTQEQSSEEEKIQKELQRILQTDCPIFSIAVRVPVLKGHASALWAEFERPFCIQKVKNIWNQSTHVEVSNNYLTPEEIQGRFVVSVGRIRQLSPHHLSAWVCSDNTLRGAACDMIDIAKIMICQMFL
ncbi:MULTISPECIES: aspartate-semialdehyde dehydrogenase [Holospora]|uniref:Aspartate-semialdehyde dehydrogenase n=2 Tax=Holospora TaxID=44747 RepID=A0A061JI43_9PROT|nr:MULTISPECIES: aspartate-semialdehyde dehydrogenase [Holospora]ETZ05217.1 aspartate-semialdehyde dehydrogenase [Holospora undulata HU1]GAJ45846.1 aspartate-semialdehyde dehydrogenase [Holospora elegans E1]